MERLVILVVSVQVVEVGHFPASWMISLWGWNPTGQGNREAKGVAGYIGSTVSHRVRRRILPTTKGCQASKAGTRSGPILTSMTGCLQLKLLRWRAVSQNERLRQQQRYLDSSMTDDSDKPGVAQRIGAILLHDQITTCFPVINKDFTFYLPKGATLLVRFVSNC